DLLITSDGAKLLSDALPRNATDVEEWMDRLLNDERPQLSRHSAMPDMPREVRPPPGRRNAWCRR
ncbi:hypothetical protein ACWEV9_35965, partial [Streptomyces albogriseolus]